MNCCYNPCANTGTVFYMFGSQLTNKITCNIYWAGLELEPHISILYISEIGQDFIAKQKVKRLQNSKIPNYFIGQVSEFAFIQVNFLITIPWRRKWTSNAMLTAVWTTDIISKSLLFKMCSSPLQISWSSVVWLQSTPHKLRNES